MKIKPADITIYENGNIRSNQFDDIYFIPEKGINESNYIFIEPSNFQEQPTTVLEFGFGTGLNFLLTLYKFQKNPTNLTFISIEKHPIIKKELIKIYNFLPSYLKQYANELINNYPDINQGKYEINIFGATLILYFDDIKNCITKIKNNIDVIYLDGFSPSKNPDMWEKNLFDSCYKILNKNGIITTFSASSNVRKALEESNFFVKKRTGFAKKRECMIAHKSVLHINDNIQSVAIVGGGITGLTIADKLQQKGYSVNLYDHTGIMTGASGNPLAILDPRFYNTNNGEGIFNRNAYLYSVEYYNKKDCFAVKGLLKHTSERIDSERLKSWEKIQKIESKHISYENDSVFLPTGGAIDTNKLKNKLAKNINFIKSKIKSPNDLKEDLIFICTGAETNKIVDINYSINRGVIGITDSTINSDKAESQNGYYINSKKLNMCLIGSSFTRVEKVSTYQPTQNDKKQIIDKTKNLIAVDKVISMRHGYRCNTKYRIPTIKQINKKTICVCGMGSRGYINAPYTAQIIIDIITNKITTKDFKILKLLTNQN